MMVALVAGILAGCGPTTVPSPSGMPATEGETDSILRLDAPTPTADTHRTMAADSTATVQNEDTTEETASGSGTDTDSIANARRDLAASIDSLNRQLLIYEQAYAQLLEVYVACTDSLRTSIESYKKAERKKPPNWVVVLVILLMGILIGGAAVGVRKP